MMNETLLRAMRRLLAAVIGLVSLALGMSVMLHALDVVPALDWARAGLAVAFDLSGEPFPVILGWVIGALVAFAAGLFLVMLALVQPPELGQQVVLSSRHSNGLYGASEVTVALESVRALVAHTAERVPGVREAAPRLRLKPAGWHIQCRVVLLPGAALPEVSSQLKQALQVAVEHHTGLPVAQVNIAAQLHALEAHRRVH